MDAPVEIPADDEALLAQCRVSTFRSTGPGGQSVNTTDSAVRLFHIPTGLSVTCRRERSQLLNKRICLARLRARLEALNEIPEPRIPTREPASVKRRVTDAKVRRGKVKRLRRPPEPEPE